MKEEVIPESLKSNHLFLLVGTNPLPNYVAARLLLKEGGLVYLVHSGQTGTYSAADRLEKLLNTHGIRQIIKIEVEESNPVDIYGHIEQVAKPISAGTVGLNYTGGTKVMAVHTHRALHERVTSRVPVVCSYLDARNYKMVFDPVGTSTPPGKTVLLEVQPKLIDLLGLHDIQLRPGLPTQETTLLQTALKLAELHAEKSNISRWRTWCDTELKKNDWNSESKLRNSSLAWPAEAVFEPVITSLCNELNLPVEAQITLANVTGNGQFKKIKHFCQWLDGKWLEHYVLAQVAKVAEASHLGDYGMNLDTDETKTRLDFEFDVAAMRGYQLFALACSTTNLKSQAKSKLFEAYVRARQLGGDEARVGVVCSYHDPRRLELDIEQSWDVPGKIKIFGVEHFRKSDRYPREFSDHLAEWFKTAH